MPGTTTCPFCGEEIEKDTQKCPHCNEMLVKICPFCGEEIKATAIKCKHCGEFLNKNVINSQNIQDTLPVELKKFNWGAFGFNWLWGICNKCYITLWIFLVMIVTSIICAVCEYSVESSIITSLIYLPFLIWFGVKGNEWAWKNKNWKSIEHFNKTQRKWAIWAGIIIGISLPFMILGLIVASEG